MSMFGERLDAEIERAREKHPPINSLHEGYAVILEEMEEFWKEVRKQKSDRDTQLIIKELVQIAAMCRRTAEDCL